MDASRDVFGIIDGEGDTVNAMQIAAVHVESSARNVN